MKIDYVKNDPNDLEPQNLVIKKDKWENLLNKFNSCMKINDYGQLIKNGIHL